MSSLNYNEMKQRFISNLMDRDDFTLHVQDNFNIRKENCRYIQGVVDGRRIKNSTDAYEALETLFEQTFLDVDLRRPKLVNSENNIAILKEIFDSKDVQELLEILNILANSDEINIFLAQALCNSRWLLEFTDNTKLSKQGTAFTYSTENEGKFISRMKAINLLKEAFRCSFKDKRLGSKIFKENPNLCAFLYKTTTTYNDISEYLNLLKSHEKVSIDLIGFSKEDTTSKIMAILKAEDFSLKLVSKQSMEKHGLQRLKSIDKITAWPMEVTEFNTYTENIINNSLCDEINAKEDYCTIEELIKTLTDIGNKNLAVKTAVNIAINSIKKKDLQNQGVQMNLF